MQCLFKIQDSEMLLENNETETDVKKYEKLRELNKALKVNYWKHKLFFYFIFLTSNQLICLNNWNIIFYFFILGNSKTNQRARRKRNGCE